MSDLSNYENAYQHARLERTGGVLEVRLHTNDDSLRWGVPVQSELVRLFRDIADDRDNRVVLLTGTGEQFIGPAATLGAPGHLGKTTSSESYSELSSNAAEMIRNLLRIEVPVVAAVNGPTLRHAELALLSDIVVASDNATFQDTAHFTNQIPPGDGQHVILPLAMGINRARYYLLTGQSISAAKAEAWGLVSEVVPYSSLLGRARELANQLAQQPRLVLRATRMILTKQIRSSMEDFLEYGLLLEGSALFD